MSPIPSVTTAFAFSTATVPLDPDTPGQSASVVPLHLLGTGGLLFAVVALVSVVGYFHHGRRAVNSAPSGNVWASLSGLFARRRGSAATDQPVDLEAGFEVSSTPVSA